MAWSRIDLAELIRQTGPGMGLHRSLLVCGLTTLYTERKVTMHTYDMHIPTATKQLRILRLSFTDGFPLGNFISWTEGLIQIEAVYSLQLSTSASELVDDFDAHRRLEKWHT